MLRALCFAFLILFASSLVRAVPSESCQEVDLNKDPQSPFNKIPMYDQDGVALCYAYAASQMVDYYRFKNGDKSYDLTNPVYAGWSAYYKSPKYFKSSTLSYGLTKDVIQSLKENGVCSNSEVKKQMAQLDGKASEPEIVKFLEAVYNNHNGWFASNDWNRTSSEVGYWTAIKCDQRDTMKARLEKQGLFAVAPTEILSGMFKDCKAHPVQIPDLETVSPGDDDKIKSKMDEALSAGMPAQVDLCARFFNQPSLRGLRGWTPFIRRNSVFNSNSDCGPHAVLVTGKMNIKGRCHYLVRNSLGSYWKPSGATACACKTTRGEYKQVCDNRSEVAEYVGCWFDQANLLPNTGSVSVFK